MEEPIGAGPGADKMHDVALVAQKAERFLRESGTRPFFLMVNYTDPHWPFARQVKGIPERPFQPDEVVPFPWQPLDTRGQRKRTAGYYGSVARLDYGVGLLLDALRSSGHDGEIGRASCRERVYVLV